MTTLQVLLHVAAQRDYELHSLDFSTAFLHGSLYEEIWLRCPSGVSGSFPAGTQWSFRRPVYGLRQVPREWHDTLKTTLAALGFTPSTAGPSLLLRTDTSCRRSTSSCTRDTLALTWILQCFDFQFSSPQPTPLSTSHSLSAPPSDESVEPSGPNPELVGCLMYLMTCTRTDLAYPLSLLARYVAPGHDCLVSGAQTGALNKAHRSAIYSPRHFLARELEQRGQLRLAYVATRANTADIFTKALPPGDHQRFSTILGLVPTLPHFLTA
ncbi:unnamed protein product [Closterium sp. NIES-53]